MLFITKEKYNKDVSWLNQLVDALKGALDQSEKRNDKLVEQLRETIVECEQLRQQVEILKRYGNAD